MASERIEGEFHYAECDGALYWIRRSDGSLIEIGGGKPWAKDRVEEHDAQANHFIQQGRQAALAEVDAAATALDEFTVYTVNGPGFAIMVGARTFEPEQPEGSTVADAIKSAAAALLTDGGQGD